MALKTTALVEGDLIRVQTRSIKRKSDGEEFIFRDALIIGENTLISVRVPDELVDDLPPVGEPLRGRVAFDTFRDDVQASLEEVLAA